ncbi:probable aminoacyl tRNA synthase complex-interacting multifunctional protein 2 isoform X2 [Monomorium pharaonis]|uniref:probable aminoacyl tRNA synthase complex-interacting multifunctional protein 2 isoform X2 n=1 Tax=Monomorium pharaonis TaxID=307658 RepID=UPI00063EE155|nr:probable aminoacyl tRNA synthase complex-interacting multifunctional protein 2 isoform X2 [Monomorium pharaonis]
MYSMRPVVTLPAKCSPSTSMYEMRSIHEDRRDDRRRRHDAADPAAETANMPDNAVVTQTPLPEYGALEARQEKILSQLAELKKQVSTLCHFLKQSNKAEATKDFVKVLKPGIIRLVLNVNPKKPPYCILALQKLWKDTNIRVISYIHSNTKTDEAPLIFPEVFISATNVIELSLIWKEVSDMEMIVDTLSYPIKGEVNFLRYLSRLLESHNYESTCLQPHTLDFALDYVNLLHHEQCIEKGLLVLADKFEKWSCKGGFNIVDIAVWSLIKQFPKTRLPPIFHEWYALCEKTFIDESFIHK